MKLLAEMNKILLESDKNTLDIAGYRVSVFEAEAEHGYRPGRLLFPASRHGPEEWSDSESIHLKVDSVKIEVKNKDQTYYVEYNLKGKDYIDDEKVLAADLKSITPEVFDIEEEPVHDPKIIAILKSICGQYAEKFDLIEYIFKRAGEKELDSDDDTGYDYDDGDELPRYYDGH